MHLPLSPLPCSSPTLLSPTLLSPLSPTLRMPGSRALAARCHSRVLACRVSFTLGRVPCLQAASFEGGHFVTWHEGQPVLHELQAGDGVLIHSERMHNVAPVTRGVRHSLVIELWVAPDNNQDRFS